jgi:Holliday junction resolvase RusA-like endonuclease
MLIYEIIGAPVPWAASRVCGTRHYNPKYKEQQQVIWQLKSQFNHEPLSCPINFSVEFYREVPKGTSRIRRQEMLNGRIRPIGKPDRTNLVKFIEDCFERAGILSNDSIIVGGEPSKWYGLVAKTVIRIEPLR